MRKPYPTDLSDVEWKCLEYHMPAPKERGRPRVHPFREILNAIFYVLKTGCLDAGYLGWGEEWAEEVLDLSVEIVHRSPKPQPEKVMRMQAKEWFKEGRNIDLKKLFPRLQGFEVLPRRWVVERTFSWLSHNRRMSKDYERLCATAESFVYAAMTRLMVRRLARARCSS